MQRGLNLFGKNALWDLKFESCKTRRIFYRDLVEYLKKPVENLKQHRFGHLNICSNSAKWTLTKRVDLIMHPSWDAWDSWDSWDVGFNNFW